MTTEPERAGDPPRSPYPGWVGRFVLPFFETSSLWPVTLALLGHVVLFQVLMLVGAVRDRSPGAAFVLALALVASAKIVAEERRRVGRLGPLAWTTLGTWLLAVPSAWASGRVGIF